MSGAAPGVRTSIPAERSAATVCGVDPSPEMREAARNRAPGGVVDLRRGTAENATFPDASFERVLMQMVVHLVDRPRTFVELCRVLAPDGRLVISTVNAAGVDRIWLSRLSPSYAATDRGCFPVPEALSTELETARFAEVRSLPFEKPIVLGRKQAVRMLRGRFASSFDLIDDDAYRAGVDRAEGAPPARIEFMTRLVVVTARR